MKKKESRKYKRKIGGVGDPPSLISADLSLSPLCIFFLSHADSIFRSFCSIKPSDRSSEAVFIDFSPPIYVKVCILLVFVGFCWLVSLKAREWGVIACGREFKVRSMKIWPLDVWGFRICWSILWGELNGGLRSPEVTGHGRQRCWTVNPTISAEN